MKTTNKFIAVSAMVMATGILLAACQREEAAGLEGLEGGIDIALQMEDLSTKVDIADKTGAGTWTEGDKIAVHVTETVGETVKSEYRDYTIEASGSYHFNMTSGITLDGYVISPSIMCDYADPAPLGSTPRVIYRTEYSMTGRVLTSPTFSYVPMMAVNDDELLYFYHVGGLVRLAMKNVPEGTNKIVVTFDGMTYVTGTCTVSNPGTVRAAATITSGSGNVVTFTGVNRSAANLYLNVPIPTGDYSALTSITVEAFQDAASKGIVRINQRDRWGTVRHGHGRVIPLNFTADALGGVRLSGTEDVTLWKSQTVQRTAIAYDAYGLEYPDATVVWTTTDDAVATVNATTGIVEAVGTGSATITATATPNTGGTSYSNSYDVYVNTFSVASVVATTSTIGPGATTSVTATLNHTNYGTILAFPSDLSVAWTSSEPTYVTVATPSSVNVGTLQSVTTATGGTDGSSSTITASVPNYGTATANCSITCKIVADLTFPSGGEKYKFRGYYMHPGSLYWNGSSFSITNGTDPLEIVTHFATEGAPPSGSNRFYLTWTDLSSVITGTVHADDAATGNHDWRIPTLTSSTAGEWYEILNNPPSHSIQINSTSAVSTNDRNYLFVNVKLPTTGTYANKGLGCASDYSSSSVGNKAYQAGMLLVPDGAHLTCPGMNSDSGHGDSGSKTASTTYNVIDYDDLLILVEKGCVFLPAAGQYNEGWKYGGYYGYYWSASQYDDSSAYSRHFYNYASYVYRNDKSSYYFPVRVVR